MTMAMITSSHNPHLNFVDLCYYMDFGSMEKNI